MFTSLSLFFARSTPDPTRLMFDDLVLAIPHRGHSPHRWWMLMAIFNLFAALAGAALGLVAGTLVHAELPTSALAGLMAGILTVSVVLDLMRVRRLRDPAGDPFAVEFDARVLRVAYEVSRTLRDWRTAYELQTLAMLWVGRIIIVGVCFGVGAALSPRMTVSVVAALLCALIVCALSIVVAILQSPIANGKAAASAHASQLRPARTPRSRSSSARA